MALFKVFLNLQLRVFIELIKWLAVKFVNSNSLTIMGVVHPNNKDLIASSLSLLFFKYLTIPGLYLHPVNTGCKYTGC